MVLLQSVTEVLPVMTAASRFLESKIHDSCSAESQPKLDNELFYIHHGGRKDPVCLIQFISNSQTLTYRRELLAKPRNELT